MTANRNCPKCGDQIPGGTLDGLCPRCLLQVSLGAAKGIIGANGDLIGRYKLLRQIGEGGCGAVYLAEQEEPVRRRVALKIVKLGMDTRAVIARFKAERQALALMDHPNIAKVFDAGSTETGRPYFVMELVDGIPINRYCDDNHLSLEDRLGLLVQVCQAIQHAHQKGIIHRDIKPSNVLVSDHNGAPLPKVIDFGIAKATTSQPLTDRTLFTAVEQFVGTPAYMSPEQARMSGLDVDTRTDIYSLGVLLYELLMGKTPFEGRRLDRVGLDETRRIIREEEPSKPSDRFAGLEAAEQIEMANRRRTDPHRLVHLIRGDLDWIVMKAMEKDRTRRYATAQGLMLDVQRHLQEEPVMARPPNKIYRFRKLIRRNKLAFGAAIGIAVALLAGTALSTWQAVRAKRAEAKYADSSKQARFQLYVTEMNLAFRYCQESNFFQASLLLHHYRPMGEEKDLRGFEWRHLYRLCRGNYARTLTKHHQVVGAIDYSPDGRLLATYCWDGAVRLWDGLQNTEKPIFQATNATGLGGFSDKGDLLIFGDRSGAVLWYDIGTQRLVKTMPGAGQLVAFAGHPHLAVTFREHLGMQFWDLAAGEIRFSLPLAQRPYLDFGCVDSVALDPLGKVMAVVKPRKGAEGAASDLGIRLWDIATGKDLGLLEDDRQIRILSFSPDGSRLAVGDGGGDVIVWDLASRQSHLIHAHGTPVTALIFSPDGTELITGAVDGIIKRWKLATFQETSGSWRGQTGAVTALALSPDGQWLASGSRDSTIKIWRREPAETPDRIGGLYAQSYGNLAFSPDARSLAAGFQDRSVKILDVDTLTPKLVLTGMLYVVAFTSDSRHLLASTAGNIGYRWDLDKKTGQPLPGYKGDLNQALCMDLSPDRRLAALGLQDGTIELLDPESGGRVALLQGHVGPVKTLRFSSDGERLVSGGSDRFVRLWDVKRATLLAKTEDEHKGAICAATFSADGSRVATGCGFGTIKLWDPDNLTNCLATIVCHESALRSLDFSRDGATLASGGEDRAVKLWNVASMEGKSAQREVASFMLSDRVRLVQFSPDDNTLAAVTDDGVLQLFRGVSKREADKEAHADQD